VTEERFQVEWVTELSRGIEWLRDGSVRMAVLDLNLAPKENHGLLLNSQKAAVRYGAGRRGAGRLTSDGIFANKIPITQYVEDRFSPGLGSDAEFYLSFLNYKQSISCTPLSINGLSLPE
jgi:hypothetical protein